MAANQIPAKTIVFLFLIIPLFLFLTSCGGTGVTLAPPDWIQGTWQSEADEVLGDYVIWEFTADNALYEYHDPVNNIHAAFDLHIDFTDKWVRDEEETGDEYRDYTIRIDRTEHNFYLEYDSLTETFDESNLNYGIWMFLAGRDWVLVKQ